MSQFNDDGEALYIEQMLDQLHLALQESVKRRRRKMYDQYWSFGSRWSRFVRRLRRLPIVPYEKWCAHVDRIIK